MNTQTFYICAHCGNMAVMMLNHGPPLVCCGEKMQALAPNTVDASAEKHVPAVRFENGVLAVSIGAAPHPMEDAHHIEFIYIATQKGGQRKPLRPGGPAEAKFMFIDDAPVTVYAYCNLHGLWAAEI